MGELFVAVAALGSCRLDLMVAVLLVVASLIWWCGTRSCRAQMVVPAEEPAVARAAAQEPAVAGAAAEVGAAAEARRPVWLDLPQTLPGAQSTPAEETAVAGAAAEARQPAVAGDASVPAQPAAQAEPQQHRPPRRRGSTPEVGWRELSHCAEAGHRLVAGRNNSAVYITCRTCCKHATWRRGDIPTFQHSRLLNDHLRNFWRDLNEHVVRD